jgi:hypothetical protein
MLLLSTALLTGCVGDGFGAAPSAHSLAWDGHEPNNSYRPRSVDGHPATGNVQQPTEREANLAKVPRNSPEWWVQQEAIAADADGKLSKKLMICRGCLPPEPDARALAIK